MSVLSWAEDILAENDYRTWWKADEADRVYFEDQSVLGMVSEYESVEKLLATWEQRQDEFLDDYAIQLRAPGGERKVWNAYTVHLTVESVSEEARDRRARLENDLFKVEEDFRGTRKLARCGLEGRSDSVEALLPLIELQHSVELRAEDYRRDLRCEIAEKFDEGFVALLAEKRSVDEIASRLLRD